MMLPVCNVAGIFWAKKKLVLRHEARLRMILPFFQDDVLDRLVVPLVTSQALVSLRLIDWFVINYSRKHRIAISPSRHLLGVYESYRTWLHRWRRDLFDAVRRGVRVYFRHREVVYETTVAQLNYVYWSSIMGVIVYAKEHVLDISKHMIKCITECRNNSKGAKKRLDLARPACAIKCTIVNTEFSPLKF